jgi:hypothetical protein
VLNQEPRLWAKEGRKNRWPTVRQAASGKRPRKEGRRVSGVHTLEAKKNPAGLNLRGVVNGLGLLTVPGKGTNDQQEGE